MDSKRKLSSTSDGDTLLSGEEDVPRKKSRNYLDSHKSIEKKRRDRINNSLTSIKEIVPDCKQYGSKKLDKAEILEMCIDYLRRVQSHLTRLGGGAESLAISPREFATEISTWVLQQKQQHTNLDSFVQALLLHLSNYGSVSQSHVFAPSSDASSHDVMASPVTTTISLAALSGQATAESHALLQAVQSYPPPYANAPRILDPHHQSQVHRASVSAAGRMPLDEAVAAQEIWRNTAALIQQQQYGSQPQDHHDATAQHSHQPPPLVAAPESLMASMVAASGIKPEMEVHNKGTTQPLHHLAMPQSQQHYQQMLIIQPGMRPLHHPVGSDPDTQHQIQQLLQQSYISDGKQPHEIQMTAQDIVHHSIRQQMLIAQGPPSTTKDRPSNTTTSTLTSAGAATLTEELIDSGSADQAEGSAQVLVQGSGNVSWDAAPVAVETTIEAGASQASQHTDGHPLSGDLHKQSANMLLLLAKREDETADKQQDASASTPVE